MLSPVALALVAIELKLHWYTIYTIINMDVNRLGDATSRLSLGGVLSSASTVLG